MTRYETTRYTVSQDRIGHYVISATDGTGSVYLQGDDARIFRDEVSAIEDVAGPTGKLFNRLLNQMCDEYPLELQFAA